MTFKEKLKLEHPEKVSSIYMGGCACCPVYYNYETTKPCDTRRISCSACWNREIPGTEPTKNKGEEKMNTTTTFTKNNLNVGYIVVCNGQPHMVMRDDTNRLAFVDSDGRVLYAADFDLNLRDASSIFATGKWNVTEVYGYANLWKYSCMVSTEHRPLLWKREDPVKKMTVEEIEKELGYKVEIVS